LSIPAKLDSERFNEGRDAYARGNDIRTALGNSEWMTDSQRLAFMLGYLDGGLAAVRRIDSLLSMSTRRGPM